VSSRNSSGILPVEKGAGVTSFHVVGHLRRVLGVSRIGHGGTLDPEATGVLPILIGEATKLTPYLVDLDKEYVATVRLGVVTDTQDLSGAVRETRPVPEIDAAAIEAALARFVGVIFQVPPMYSALRRGGKRLYQLARDGLTVEREPRPVTVHAITLESVALPSFTMRVRCGKGTYVRTLAADLGEAFGCGGALERLVRTRVGPYRLESSAPWSEIQESRDGASLWARLLPPDSALGALPAVHLESGSTRPYVNGQTVACPPGPIGLVRVYGPGAELLGIGACRGGAVKPERILHADSSRPRVLPA